MHPTTRSREATDTGRRDRRLMSMATTSTADLGVAAKQSIRAVPTAPDSAGAPSHGSDLDEASRLTRRLVARAKRLDDLREHSPELMGFQGAFVSLFENVERAVAELMRTRLPVDPDPTFEGDR